MKNLLLILTILISSVVYSQTYSNYPMYSDIWNIEYSKNGGYAKVIPKDTTKQFDFDISYVLENIDEDKIRGYMLEEYNKFRKDYGVMTEANESKLLSENAQEWSKTLKSSFKHSKGLYGEVIALLPLMSFTNIVDVDLNKIIASSCFDQFTTSKGHMKILLEDDEDLVAGFGVFVNGGMIYTCIQTNNFPVTKKLLN